MAVRWRRIGLAAGWSAVIAWALLSVWYAHVNQLSNGGDFGMYYAAAETLRFAPQSDVYLQRTLTATVLAHGGCGAAPIYPYPYQPLLALLLKPLTYLSCEVARQIWFAFNFALWFGVSVFYSVHTWRQYGSLRALVVAIMALGFLPALNGIIFGQVHLVLLTCTLAAMLLIAGDHEYAGGALLGFGAVLKYFPVVLIVYYLLRGRWRVTGSAALVSAAFVTVEALAVGPQRLIESIAAGENDVRYYAGVSGHWMNVLPAGASIGYGAAIISIAVVIWLRWGREKRAGNQLSKDHELIGASWTLTVMLMLSPLIWWYYLTWLLPALIICLHSALQYARRTGLQSAEQDWRALVRRWWPSAMLALIYYLLVIMLPIPGFRAPVIGVLLLWALCGALYLWSAGFQPPQPADKVLGRPRAPYDLSRL